MSMSKTRPFRGWRFVLVAGLAALGAGAAAQAAKNAAPGPNETPVAVVTDAASAQAAIDKARTSGQAIIADLTLGHEGQLVRAKTAAPLSPGRYRLHALVASTSHDQLLGEAVALRLTAGGSQNVFDPKRWFSEPGKLAPVRLDFVVDKSGQIPVAADWIVGDSKLDREKYRELAAARKAYLAQRQNAINQWGLRGGPDKAMSEAAPDDSGLGDAADDLLAKETPRLAARALAGAGLPAHRLMLCGLVVERLSPVAVVSVQTDKPAYEPNAVGSVVVRLRNYAGENVAARLDWTVDDDSRPGKPIASGGELVTLAGDQQRDYTLKEPLATAGISRLGRVRVSIAVEGLSGDSCRTPFVVLPPAPTRPPDRPKKVFAHYMGCYPAGTGHTRDRMLTAGEKINHERGDDKSRSGWDMRNFPLVPQEPGLTAEESADLEIRRAMRIGIDGFAVDAWAGGDGAKKVFDTLIKVAEAKNYPFEMTICLDNAGPGDVRSLIEKYGQSPKLARRDGKPLVFTYFSHGHAMGTLYAELDDRIPDSEHEAAVNRMRATELGWHLIGQTFRKWEEIIGQPVFFTYDLVYFFHGVPGDLVKPDMPTRAAAAIARHVPVLASFGFYGFAGKHAEIAKVVHDAGAEWGWAGGMHQKESFLELFMPKGTEWLRFIWSDTCDDQATLLQLISWNDYTENTNIAPAYNTRYTIYDLTGYFIERWRTGKQPAIDHDRVYLTYAKYPKGAKAWPFAIRRRSDRALEVLTILTAPAKVRLPGRNIEYDAPAGLEVKQFPITPGEVVAEVVRDGKTVVELKSPEPITDRPFREDNAMVCYSTEFMRHWKADFGDTPPLLYSEYGDADGDGLPNWFEMYWFTKERGFKPVESDDILPDKTKHPLTKWLDLSTATAVDPNADPDRDGKTNLQEYLDRTDPTTPPAGKAPARSDLTDEPASE